MITSVRPRTKSTTVPAGSIVALELANQQFIVLSRDATVGRCGILSVPMATSQHFVNYICGPDLDPEYLLLTFRWPMQWEFQRLTMGSTLRTIGLPDVDSFRIALPPIDEQRESTTSKSSVSDTIQLYAA